ncbi:MAG: AarF/ABC1/UbiB kinase family protein [Candidatus Hydrogenedentota bacterium]
MHYQTLGKRVGNAVRLAEVIQVLVRHGFADLVRRIGLHEGLPAKLLQGLRVIEAPSGEPETFGRRLRAALTELGPSFVKVGQILSTRPDLVGHEICAALSYLQDKVDPVDFEEIRPVIEGDLGISVESLFAEFTYTPMAAASLSQVYHARLHDGADVVVKIQRPGIRAVIESDLNLIRRIAEWIVDHVSDFQWIDPVATVDEFGRSIHRELDFAIEARLIERFRENYAGDTHVFVPKVYRDRSSGRVITMDYVHGERVDNLDAYERLNCDPKQVAATGCDTICKQVFKFHLFHADPHPGNIMVMQDNRIAFLDYGMVGHLERPDVQAIAELLRSIFQDDPEGCVQVMLRFTTTADMVDRTALTHEVADFIAFEAQTILGRADVSRVIEQLTNTLRRHRMELAPRFSLLLKALATIESTGHALNPELNMVPILQPYAEEVIRNRFSPRQLAEDAQQNAIQMLRLGREVPREVQQLLGMLRRGRLRIQLNHEGLEHLANVTDRASNRLTFSVIAGSIIVGSSMLLAADIGLYPIGLAGYSVAGLLGVALLISILRSRNF